MPKSGAEKIGVRAGSTLTLVNAPGGDTAVLGQLPANVVVTASGGAADLPQDAGAADVVLLFVADAAELARHAPALFAAAGPDAATKLWIAYRKGKASDLGRDTLMPAFADLGWHGVTLVSLDETWSAGRFRRLEDIKRR